MNAYIQALRRTVEPGAFVVEIGTGAGVFAMLACKLGARRVVAIEPDDVIELARELASDNGYAESIEFIKAASTDVTLSEPADVIVSDLRGALPLYRGHIPSLVDARARLLAPGGTLIPWRDTIWATIVHEPKSYARFLDPWRALPGLEADGARRLVTNTWWTTRFTRRQLLADPQRWAVLDYHTIEDPNVVGSLDWTLSRSGTTHGVGMWFDAELAEGVAFSGAPGKAALIYRHAFFPFPEPLELSPSDRVSIDIQANLVGGDYQWRWKTKMWTNGDSGAPAASFDQSTVHGTLLTPARLHRTMATHTPELNDEGEIVRFALEEIARGITLEQLGKGLAERFPTRFASWEDGFDYATGLSLKYGR